MKGRLVLSICLLTYCFSARGYLEVSDTHFSLQTAEALVTRGELNINYSEGATFEGPEGRNYSKYGIGLPVYHAAFVAASKVLSKATGLSASAWAGFFISFGGIPFAILALAVFAKLLRLLGVEEGQGPLLLLGLGLGTLTWRYACSDFSEIMQMAMLTLAVYGVIRGSKSSIFIAGFACAWLLLLKLVFAALLPILALYLFTRPGDWRHRLTTTAAFSLPILLAIGLLGWLNAIRFGNAWESGYSGEAGLFFPEHIWWTIPQLLGSLDKGMFLYSPVLILALFGWKSFAGKHRAEAALCGALIIGNLLLTAAWHSWMGGWSWGPRLLVPLIPLWFLPAAFAFPAWLPQKRFMLLAATIGFSIFLQIPAILVYDNEIHHLKDDLLTSEEQPLAASDYTAAWILLKHKLTSGNEVYRVSEFSVPGDRTVDLSQFKGFTGLNIWTEQIARQLNKPLLRWFPLFGLLAATYLLTKLKAAYKP